MSQPVTNTAARAILKNKELDCPEKPKHLRWASCLAWGRSRLAPCADMMPAHSANSLSRGI